MFGKLKEALKKSFSIFSRKVEEKAEEKAEDISIKERASPEPIRTPTKNIRITRPDQITGNIKQKSDEKSEAPQPPPITHSKKEKRGDGKKETGLQETQIKEPICIAKSEEEKNSEKRSLFATIFKKEKTEDKEQIIEEEQATENTPAIKTTSNIFTKTKELLTTRRLSPAKFEELFWDIEIALLENNVAVEVVQLIKDELKAKLTNNQLPRDLGSVLHNTLKEVMSNILVVPDEDIIAKVQKKKPFIIAFFGINGSGKTTTIAKVAHILKENKLSCVIAAADTFRAAAIQQIEEHGVKLGIKVVKHDYGSDAAAVAFDAVSFAKKNNLDVVLIDTAGRLHSDTNLMDELKKIVRVAKPDLKIFVGESITGNDCIEQTKEFDQCTGIDAIILTKTDVDEKGGTALSISYMTKKPILYLGSGQSYADLKSFNKEMVMQNLGL